MSVNREIHVGLWIPKSVPYTAMSASLSSRRVGSPLGPSCCSVVTTRNVFPSSILWRPDAGGVVTDARRRLLGQLDLGDQVAPRRIPARELDAGRLADHAASSIAPDEISRGQRLAAGQPDIDPGV